MAAKDAPDRLIRLLRAVEVQGRLAEVPPEEWSELPDHTIVYIAEAFEPGRGQPRLIGHVELQLPGERTFIVEGGPGWDDAEAAVAWGRTRAPVVIVRLGIGWGNVRIYSAGDRWPTVIQPDHPVLPWPPEEP